MEDVLASRGKIKKSLVPVFVNIGEGQVKVKDGKTYLSPSIVKEYEERPVIYQYKEGNVLHFFFKPENSTQLMEVDNVNIEGQK